MEPLEPSAHPPIPHRQQLETPPARIADEGERRLRELAFLHEFAQLATQARDWDELMQTLIERTTVAMGVEVCSFYLLNPEGTELTLVATNGLDPAHVGRVHLRFGEGVTGAAAMQRVPIEVPDVRTDPRFRWVRGYDLAGLVSMLSVPLIWNESVVGVLNVQTVESRRFSPHEIEFMVTIAALLAGIVAKGRLQAEQEAQLEQLHALDSARAELLSLVTHELRTPLAVVRAYLDLLAEAAAGTENAKQLENVHQWYDAAVEQVMRLDRLVNSILAAVRGTGLTGLRREPFDLVAATLATIDEMAPLLRQHPIRWEPGDEIEMAIGDESRLRQVLELLLENEAKYSPAGGGVSIGTWREDGEVRIYVTDDGAGIPIEDWESVFDPFVRVARHPHGSGIGLYASRRLMEAMGGRVWLEPNGFGGSRFVVALPSAEAASTVEPAAPLERPADAPRAREAAVSKASSRGTIDRS